jgi:D-3-phosphoglycerate dehydrogenase
MDREVRSRTWSTREGVQLFGKTLGVIGLGGIGREVLRIGGGLLDLQLAPPCRD